MQVIFIFRMFGFNSNSSKYRNTVQNLLRDLREETTEIGHDASIIVQIEQIVEKAEAGEMPIEIAAYRLGRVRTLFMIVTKI